LRYVELSVQVPPDALAAVCDLLHGLGTGGLVVDDEELARVRVWLPQDGRLEARLAAVQAGLTSLAPHAWDLGRREVDDGDWAHAWKRFWHASRLGRRLVVAPSWEAYEPGPDDLVIRLDPGMAFGTGTHATTVLCLRQLEARVGRGCTVADVGTGSGILAIAAALLGAERVWAVDIDPVAVRVAAENLARNGVADRVTLWEGGPARIARTCDIVVANLTADLHVALAAAEAALVAPGGVLIASGIVAAEAARVADVLRALGLAPSAPDTLDGWACIPACRPRPA
jgi:ribosomal protein L11 methyltransferase